MPSRQRPRRALLMAVADRADRSRSLSPIRSAASSAASIHPTPFESSLFPMPRPRPDPTPPLNSDLLQLSIALLTPPVSPCSNCIRTYRRTSAPLAPRLRTSCSNRTPLPESTMPCRARPSLAPPLPRLSSTASPPPTGNLLFSAFPHKCPLALSRPSASCRPPTPQLPQEPPAYGHVDGGFVALLPSGNSCLQPEKLTQLRQLLYEFRDRFNDGSAPLPATNLLTARLDTGDAAPISTPPRRLSPAMRQVVRDAAADLDAKGIAEPSTGCWAAPMGWSPRPPEPGACAAATAPSISTSGSGSNRFPGAMTFSPRSMTSAISPSSACATDSIRSRLPEKTVRSPTSSPPTASIGVFPSALPPAQPFFKRMVDVLSAGMKWVSSVGYIDDLAVYSDTWAGHCAHLRQLLTALRAANLQFHPAKCCFGTKSVHYLSHVVSRPGVQPCPSKVKAILDMPPRANAKAVPRFLGKCPYCHKFIPHFSIIASRALHDHERKWTATEPEAAAVICALESFRHYIGTVDVCIRTDHAPLEYTRNNSSQCRRLECWALRLGNSDLRTLLSFSMDFPTARSSMPAPPLRPRSRRNCGVTLYAPLTRRQQKRHQGSRSLRHRLKRLCVAAHAGQGGRALASTDDDGDVEVCLTDTEDEAPSQPATPRIPSTAEQFIHEGRNIRFPPAVNRSSVHRAQQQDPECQEFQRLLGLSRSEWPPHLQPTPLRFCLVHDLLCVSIADATPHVVLQATFRRGAIPARHLSYYGGHLGVTMTAARLACRYWWPHLRHDVRAYLRTCTFCLAHADFPKKLRWLNLPMATPFEPIAIDRFGPLPPTQEHTFWSSSITTRAGSN
ncbi:hypothetical protein ACSSS7_006338 [Eimeria intestinalis]